MLNAKKITGIALFILGLILIIIFVNRSSLVKNILGAEGFILILTAVILFISACLNTSVSINNSINKLSVIGLLSGISGVMAFWFPWLGLALAGVGLILSAVSFIMALKFKSITTLIIISLFVSLTGVNISGFFTFKTMKYANAISIKYKKVNKLKENNSKKFLPEIVIN